MIKKFFLHTRSMQSERTAAAAYGTDSEGEQTFVMLKPDAVERGVVNEVLTYFQEYNEEHPDRPLYIQAMTKMRLDADLVEEHYSNVDGDIMEELHAYFGTQADAEWDEGYAVVPMAVYGENAVDRVRELVVDPIDTDEDTFLPENSEPGTIRGDLVEEGSRLYVDPEEYPYYQKNAAAREDVPIYNLVHASEDMDDAREEIERFFGQYVDADTSDATQDAFFGYRSEDELSSAVPQEQAD